MAGSTRKQNKALVENANNWLIYFLLSKSTVGGNDVCIVSTLTSNTGDGTVGVKKKGQFGPQTCLAFPPGRQTGTGSSGLSLGLP